MEENWLLDRDPAGPACTHLSTEEEEEQQRSSKIHGGICDILDRPCCGFGH